MWEHCEIINQAELVSGPFPNLPMLHAFELTQCKFYNRFFLDFEFMFDRTIKVSNDFIEYIIRLFEKGMMWKEISSMDKVE